MATAVDLVAWDSPEVGTPGHGVSQLLDLLKVIRHDCWVLCHLEFLTAAAPACKEKSLSVRWLESEVTGPADTNGEFSRLSSDSCWSGKESLRSVLTHSLAWGNHHCSQGYLSQQSLASRGKKIVILARRVQSVPG